MAELIDQKELTKLFCARPQNFAWFLGAGTSRSAGLPTAGDVIWDLKRQIYCNEENQEIARQDIQNEAVRQRIQDFLDARGYPLPWSDEEYSTYFEKMFGEDREQQRRYLKAMLDERRVSLSVGNRVLGALMSAGLTRMVFTTNFDSVVEKAVAEVASESLSAFHIEGSRAANDALNNEELPIYCKLHGDFRYDSIKNLSADLARQNDELAACMTNAGARFGFVVAGYSGRDESIMKLFHGVLDGGNPFPHGLYWTGLKGNPVPPAVQELLEKAAAKGVNARYVDIETFDALMLKLWRNIDQKPQTLDAQVSKTGAASVNLPLPAAGGGKPLLRFNALPVRALPPRCLALTFKSHKEWADLRQARHDTEGRLILTRADEVWCWGTREMVAEHFGDELLSESEVELPADFGAPENLHVKGFLEEAICAAISRHRPLLSRISRGSAHLIIDPHTEDRGALDPLSDVTGKTSGIVPGLFSAVTDEHPQAEQVRWSEAARISLDIRDGSVWLLVDPDVWIWPARSRQDAADFLSNRRRDRMNSKYNALLSAWVKLILGTEERGAEVTLSVNDSADPAENPAFLIGSRTAFSRRLGR